MRAVNYLKKRFQTSLQYKRPIYVNQTDVDALNKIIEFCNNKQKNTELEDALLLFYLLCVYKVQNAKNKLVLRERDIEDVRFPLGMPDAYDTLRRLSLLINPKEEVIRQIADEIWIYQEYERVHKDRDLYLKEVEEGMAKWGEDVVVTKQEKVPIKKEDFITYEQVEELLNDLLQRAKGEFPNLEIWNRGQKFKEIKPLNSINPDRWK